MFRVLALIGVLLTWSGGSHASREAETLFLRQQLLVLRRSAPSRPRLKNSDRLIFVWLYRLFPSLIAAAVIFRDCAFGAAVTQRLQAMGIRDRPIAPRSPWQNSYVERVIGLIRRECLDHVIVIGEAHLRRHLTAYAAYYSGVRTHLALGKDAPMRRPVQSAGRIAAKPLLGGLHHHYVRKA